MNRRVVLLAGAALALAVALCPRPGVPELNEVLQMDPAAVFQRVRGQSRQQLAEAWGAPDRTEENADMWTADGVSLFAVYYRPGSDRPVLCSRWVDLLPDETHSLQVTHSAGSTDETRALTGEEITAVRDWAAGLDLERRSFEPRQQPNQVLAGGEAWAFTADGLRRFVYLSLDEDYILFREQWFAVQNPSPPPV